MVQFYFEKKRPFAGGISTVGHSLGTVIMLPLINLLIQHYGVEGALILHAGITMQIVVLASLFRPIDVKAIDKKNIERNEKEMTSQPGDGDIEVMKEENDRENKKELNMCQKLLSQIRKLLLLWDFNLWKKRFYVQFLVAMVLQEYGVALMYRFTSVKAVADGLTTMEAALLPSITGMF